ncbi:MAG: glycosyltransferase [Acidobacteria bacterium]|nr:glycosyltransferase [Acidobacteriota bacterium]
MTQHHAPRRRRVVLFYHSLVSDWNHGNAHFLRGVASELLARGHEVAVYEPADGWSAANLRAEQGTEPFERFRRAYPGLASRTYALDRLDLDEATDGADLVLVHEWNDPELVARLGRHRAASPGYRLLFHDTHHRAASDSGAIAAFDLEHYDGVLAFGESLRELYLSRGWAAACWTWHEAADTRVFRPLPCAKPVGDLVWVGNWGDEERARELQEFFLGPVRSLGLEARVHGVRYPPPALEALRRAGVEYAGWLPNFDVPRVFSAFRATVHVPRRPYAEALPGIPTIRVFEALACGIPLVCAPWDDAEGLFRPGRDYLVARDGAEMREHLRFLLHDALVAARLAASGLETILARHTCAHRVDELLAILDQIEPADGARAPAARPQEACS